MLIKFIVLLTFLISHSAFAQGYFLGQAGYGQLNQRAISSNNVYPSGYTYGVGGGIRQSFFEIEGLLQKIDLAGDINHDGASNGIKHEQTSFTFAINFYLSKRFYARLGYSMNRIDQSLEEKISDASMEGARKSYDLHENANADGVTYGGGFVLYDSSSLGIFTQFENLSMPSASANTLNFSVGIRVYSR